ncbi:MAG: hypothetical protein K0S55_1735, partial [Clostridia bacterium]|nr:hypothetical protein [Clostridia bacterium]
MPFPMVHLCMAKEIIKYSNK